DLDGKVVNISIVGLWGRLCRHSKAVADASDERRGSSVVRKYEDNSINIKSFLSLRGASGGLRNQFQIADIDEGALSIDGCFRGCFGRISGFGRYIDLLFSSEVKPDRHDTQADGGESKNASKIGQPLRVIGQSSFLLFLWSLATGAGLFAIGATVVNR